MDLLIAQITTDLRSSDALRQSLALLQALQQCAAGRDVSALARTAATEILSAPSSAVCKRLALDLLRALPLPPDLLDPLLLSSLRSDLSFPDPDVASSSIASFPSLPSHLLPSLLSSAHAEIANALSSPAESLRLGAVTSLSSFLPRDDLVLMCSTNPSLMAHATTWWARLAELALDSADAVSAGAFEALARLFQELEGRRMSRLAGDKLVDGEGVLAVRAQWAADAIDFIWSRRNMLIARSVVMPAESFRLTVHPLVHAAKMVASGVVNTLQRIAKPGDTTIADSVESSAEKLVGVSDIVSHLLPFLSSLDPPLVFEVGINMLALADVPGGKPEWASAAIIAILTLWDRQEFSSMRETIVRAVVTNLHLLDLGMQVSLFKRLLQMVRNLRAESDRMHALACICRTALCVDLFAKESVRRGQKPVPGTDVISLFEDVRLKEDLNSVTSKNLFREELVASLVESCFQLSLPLPELKNSGTESRVIGALAYGTGYGALNWTEPALDVVEVCRPCVLWDCDGRTYAVDCYLKLFGRLCHIYDTRGGVKTIKAGASQDQILNEMRLRNLQLQLIRDLREVHTPRISSRLIWAISEHFDLEGLDPLLADDPEDPLNIIISNMHKILFNIDSSATTSNRIQDVQAVLICAQRLGARNTRAGQLLTKELEEFRASTSADSVTKHQSRYVLQVIKYVTNHPNNRWVAVGDATGDYPFSHHKLTVQFSEASAAQDRKLEVLVHKAIQELWRPHPSQLTLLQTKGISALHKELPKACTLTGSSDPCYIEAYHLADPTDGRITLHLKILNLTELELNRVDIRVGLSGALYYMDGFSRTVRHLGNLVSQDPVQSSVTVGVSHFERCSLWVQVLYYPFYGSGGSADYEGNYAEEEDSQMMRQKRSLRPELGEPVVLRCQPYKFPLAELLLPLECSPVEYFRLWPSLPAMVECTGTYTYEGSGFKATAAQQYDSSPFLGGLKSISSKPFHQVCSHFIRTVAGFQLCYAAKTWFGGFVGMMIFGASEVSRNVDLGDETTTMICKFVMRASNESITREIESDLQGWLDDITDGAVEYMPEDEVKSAAAERLKISMERISLLKAAKPKVPPAKTEQEEEEERKQSEELDGFGNPKGPSTLSKLTAEEAEHRALQAAVLQEWHQLCKEKAMKAQ
ncbi:protein TPLATE [Zea mays]|uniref:Protein TPLATE n=1 Tax=Zea mays TaxID=4577 RepID=A0A1D6QLL5_MAIZE|nr:protein TPLATE [Zea mays]AQK58581.1 Protein TPLATE [Zea mays]AQK58583.1 Protein TPLATE [Zea mays]|eukprot:XP_008679631.1 protein TPLATE [Zea mays]